MVSPMKRTLQISFVAILVSVIAFAWVSPAYAAEDACTLDGGTWSGIDPDNGSCTYPPGNPIAVAACGSSTTVYEVTYEFDTEMDVICIETRVPPSETRIRSNGGSEENFILRLNGDRNGWVEFFGGSCLQNCTIDYILPDLAKESTIDTPLAALYVRVDGGAGTGSYRVCFNNPYGEGMNLYQFIGGNWSLVNFSHSNPICAVASGDGAFYLH